MGSEELEIGFAFVSDPVCASSPMSHETCQHHRLVFLHVSLHKLIVTEFFPIHLLYLSLNSDTHCFSLKIEEETKGCLLFFIIAFRAVHDSLSMVAFCMFVRSVLLWDVAGGYYNFK